MGRWGGIVGPLTCQPPPLPYGIVEERGPRHLLSLTEPFSPKGILCMSEECQGEKGQELLKDLQVMYHLGILSKGPLPCKPSECHPHPETKSYGAETYRHCNLQWAPG